MSDNQVIESKRQEIAEIDQQIDDLAQRRAIASAMLEGMLMMVSTTSKDEPNEDRRMRLGSKKRVVYSLIQNGYETLNGLSDALRNSDIEPRYVRDVIRKAISLGDVLGKVDDKFILSDMGKELLQKAPRDKDWSMDYEALCSAKPSQGLSSRMPSQLLAPAQPAIFGGTTSTPNSDTIMSIGRMMPKNYGD